MYETNVVFGKKCFKTLKKNTIYVKIRALIITNKKGFRNPIEYDLNTRWPSAGGNAIFS